MKVTPGIESVGFGISGNIGGLPRTTYYTPDGRIIRAIPNIREYIIRNKEGQITGSGTRDANLDKGWLLSPPTILKLFCKTCDRWHDTQEEVKACGVERTRFINVMEVKAKQEEADKTASLEQKVGELMAMVEKLMGDKRNGELLQSASDALEPISGEEDSGKNEARV